MTGDDSNALRKLKGLRRRAVAEKRLLPSEGGDRIRAPCELRVERTHTAAESHVENDRYLKEFDRVCCKLSASSIAASRQASGSSRNLTDHQEPKRESDTRRRHSKDGLNYLCHPVCSLAFVSPLCRQIVDGWLEGPKDELGRRVNLTERPVICAAVNVAQSEVCFGTSDHALYVLDPIKVRVRRKLYTRTCGHTEWVTCCAYLPDNSIVSGGMDSRLCWWKANSTVAKHVEGHRGPVSQLQVVDSSNLVLSASYDKTIRVWASKGEFQGCLSGRNGHNAPVLEMQAAAKAPPEAVSGDRSGGLRCWDIGRLTCTTAINAAHKGHVTSLAWCDQNGGNEAWARCFASGGQDGYLRIWDPRGRSNMVASCLLHGGDEGVGAVTGVIMGGAAASYAAVTCGADKTVRLLDSRNCLTQVEKIDLSELPYSMTAAGGLVSVGCGDGRVHVIDVATSQAMYVLGANLHAVRTLTALKDKLICSGDDGSCTIYSFC